MSLLEKKSEQRRLSLAGQIQAAYFGCMRKLSAVFEATSTFVRPYLCLTENSHGAGESSKGNNSYQ